MRDMKVLRYILMTIAILSIQYSEAQEDTTIFKFKEFMELVKENHPISMSYGITVKD